MSRPDKPGPVKNNQNGDKGLHDSIDELEYLIGDNNADDTSGHQQSGIPVLEDVVDPDDYIEAQEGEEEGAIPESFRGTGNAGSITDEQIAELLENVEERISGELSELVDILKDTIKDSIITELKSELKNEFRRTDGNDDDQNR